MVPFLGPSPMESQTMIAEVLAPAEIGAPQQPRSARLGWPSLREPASGAGARPRARSALHPPPRKIWRVPAALSRAGGFWEIGRAGGLLGGGPPLEPETAIGSNGFEVSEGLSDGSDASVEGMKKLFVFTRPRCAIRRRESTEHALALGDEKHRLGAREWLGEIALGRSDHDTARGRYEEALPLYQRVVMSSARLTASRASRHALGRSDHDTARARYEEAFPSTTRRGCPREADCIKSLVTSRPTLNHDTPALAMKRPLSLYQRVGDVPRRG